MFLFKSMFIQWLDGTFLGFVNDWKHECDTKTDIPKDLRSRMCLSYQAIEGLRITDMR